MPSVGSWRCKTPAPDSRPLAPNDILQGKRAKVPHVSRSLDSGAAAVKSKHCCIFRIVGFNRTSVRAEKMNVSETFQGEARHWQHSGGGEGYDSAW